MRSGDPAVHRVAEQSAAIRGTGAIRRNWTVGVEAGIDVYQSPTGHVEPRFGIAVSPAPDAAGRRGES